MEKLCRTKLIEKIAESTGSNYRVWFKKKDGTKREMYARQGVEYNLKGGTNRVVKPSNDYISTFDVDKFAYRTINLATVYQIEVNGKLYQVTD